MHTCAVTRPSTIVVLKGVITVAVIVEGELRGVRVLSTGGLGLKGEGSRGVVDQWLMEAKQAAACGPFVVQKAACRGRTVPLAAVSPASPPPHPSHHLNTLSKKKGGSEGEEKA